MSAATRNVASIAGLVLAAVVALAGVWSQGLASTQAEWTQRAYLEVDNANNLLPRGKVTLRGVVIGQVSAVNVVPSGVRISFRYSRNYGIPRQSDYRIDQLSALGETYVDITPHDAGGPNLDDGATVQGSRVASFADTTRMVMELSREISPKVVAQLTDAVLAALPEGDETPTRIRSSADLFFATVASKSDAVRRVMRSGGSILQRSPDVVANVRDMLSDHAAVSTSRSFLALAEVAVGMMKLNDYPRIVEIGPLALFSKIQKLEDEVGPSVYALTKGVVAPITSGLASLRSVTSADLVSTALALTANPGAITLGVR